MSREQSIPQIGVAQVKKYQFTRGDMVAATHPWDMFPQHFHVCANVVILSLLHVSATRPCYMSPQHALHKFFVAANDPSCLARRVDESVTLIIVIVLRSVKANTKYISGSIWHKSSIQTPNTIALKTGFSNKVYVMRRLH